MTKPPLGYTAWLHVSLSDVCNLECHYCISDSPGYAVPKTTGGKSALAPIDPFVRSLDDTGQIFKVIFTGGGEPFLTPNIVELCQALTKRHYVGFTTNLTVRPRIEEFAQSIDPRRVTSIHASVHLEELERKNAIESFATSYRLLEDRDFPIQAKLVSHPTLASRADEIRDRFATLGVDVIFLSFIGEHEGKQYPRDYSGAAREAFRLADSPAPFSPKGQLCNAGYNVAMVDPQGKVRVCGEISDSLGDLDSGFQFRKQPMICPMESCRCPYFTFDHHLISLARQAARARRLVPAPLRRIVRATWRHLRPTYRRAQQLPSPVPENASPAECANACRKLLRQSFTEFYLRSLDREHGGYLDELAADGSFAPAHRRVSVFQLRQLWFFSALAQRDIGGEPVRDAARHGFEYLQSALWDRAHDGIPIQVTDNGIVDDGRKHTYVHSIALQALAAYHAVFGCDASTLAIERCWNLLETHAHDETHGGYHELFRRNWTRLEDPEQRYIGRGGQKTFSTHMHILEAFAELYRVQPNPALKERLVELLGVVHGCARNDSPRSLDRFHTDWSVAADDPANQRVSFGHDVEAAWFQIDAATTIGADPDPYLQRARAVIDDCMKHGYDHRRGGLFHTLRDDNIVDTTKFSWSQAEMMCCLLTLFQHTREAADYQHFVQTLRFTAQQMIVPAGGSWVSVRADGSRRRDATRTGYWEGGYHVGRALLYCAESLEALSS
ncbi:MAG: AGE family epimerase/isomerase [Planctomycetota bacterium]